MAYTLTAEQLHAYEKDGHFIARRLVDATSLDAIREGIGRGLDEDDSEAPWRRDGDRADGAVLEGRERFRKIGQYARRNADLWRAFLTHDNVIDVHRRLLGDDIRLWYDSVFTKPAGTGEQTPWHQDIGLWTFHPSAKARKPLFRDALSIWIAVDPATRANGCLQFAPGSHHGDVVEHIKYDAAIHPELPRELVADVDPVHVELEPGDAVVWHAHAWHHSPPNTSDENRWGIACVTLREEAAQQAELAGYPALVVGGVAQPFGASR